MKTAYWIIGLTLLIFACSLSVGNVGAQAASTSTTIWETFTNSTTITLPTTSFISTTATQTTTTILTRTNTSMVVSITTVPAFTLSTTTSVLQLTSTTTATTLVPQIKQEWLTVDQLIIVSLLELIPLIIMSALAIKRGMKRTNGNSRRIDPKKMKPK